MRLLTYTHEGQLSIMRDLFDHIPPYAILSHTWIADEEEVTHQELQHNTDKRKAGYRKIEFCGEQAKRDGITHFWVDTCCIDKANHVELSEAIASMYRWYQQAQKCYVYLADVSTRKRSVEGDHLWEASFEASRWFTRGWTLQELLAPRVVEFFSREGDLLGTKQTLASQIHKTTSIPLAALHGAPLTQFPIPERIRWSQERRTKKKEDRAYCLLGIFDVFMPLIYGEGENALRRLEKEINERYGAGVASGLSGSPATRSLGLCLKSAPIIPPSDFVGRAHEIGTLHDILRPDQAPTEQHRAVLGGIGGIGKTQLALAYARQHQQSYMSVLWLNATSESTLNVSLRSIAQRIRPATELQGLDDDGTLQAVLHWLSDTRNTSWLLIFDNYDDPDLYGIDRYLPNTGHGSIIITTRLPDLVQGQRMQQVRVCSISDLDESLEILQTRSRRGNVQHGKSAPGVQWLDLND